MTVPEDGSLIFDAGANDSKGATNESAQVLTVTPSDPPNGTATIVGGLSSTTRIRTSSAPTRLHTQSATTEHEPLPAVLCDDATVTSR